jgi:hypothetical protein
MNMTSAATVNERRDDPELRILVTDATYVPPGKAEATAPPLAPMDVRTLAILTIVVMAAPFALYAGAGFFIPLAVSQFLSYSLSPMVARFERFHVPRALSSAFAMAVVIVVTALGVQLAIAGATEVLEDLPRAVQKVRFAITSWERDDQGALKQVRKTADELQKLAGATTSAVTAAPPSPAVPAPQTAPAASEPKVPFAAGTLGMAIFLGRSPR